MAGAELHPGGTGGGRAPIARALPDALASAILDAAPDCVIVIDAAGMILALNGAAEETFGYAAEDALGRELVSLLIAPRMRQRLRGAVRNLAAARPRSLLGRRVELAGVRADGSELEIELTIAALDTDPPLYAAFLRDVTEPHRDAEAKDLLAAAGAAFDSSLDPGQTMRTIAATAVPKLAELCTIDLLGRDGGIERTIAAATEPALATRLERLRAAERVDLGGTHPVARALREGRPVVIHDLAHEGADPDALTGDPRAGPDGDADAHTRLMLEAGFRSVVVMTLVTRGRLLGALSFAHLTESPFEQSHLALMQELADRAAMALDNANLYAERAQEAQTLQRSLMPEALPQLHGLDLACAYHPVGAGNEVGGDFYDVFELPTGCWLIVGDVCGKGPEAAAVTSLVRHTIRAFAFGEASPARVLQAVNRVMLSHELAGRFATAVIAKIDHPEERSRRLTIASAGHPPPVLLDRDGHAHCPRLRGSLLGVMQEISPDEHTARLRDGDAIVLYTDGLLDAGAPQRTLTPEALCVRLSGRAGASPRRLVSTLDRLATSRGAGHLRDDIAIVVARVDS